LDKFEHKFNYLKFKENKIIIRLVYLGKGKFDFNINIVVSFSRNKSLVDNILDMLKTRNIFYSLAKDTFNILLLIDYLNIRLDRLKHINQNLIRNSLCHKYIYFEFNYK
jgi:hypothetical protein